MMRILCAIFAFLINLSTNGQNLVNTEWTKIKAQRKDGSRIITSDSTASLKLYFFTDSVFAGLFHQYAYKQHYSIRNEILTIGESTKYQIDSANDIFLFVSQISNKADDALNSYVFINSDDLFDYLQQNQQLNITGDSMVVCNDQFSPTYIGGINEILDKQLPGIREEKYVRGSFSITASGNIKDIYFDTTKNFSNKEIEKAKKALYLSRGAWILPPTPTPLQFKMNFVFESKNYNNLWFTSFRLFPNNTATGLTSEQKATRDNHYNKGVISMKKEKFETAISEFRQCIQIDPPDLDPYYNLAYCYQKIQNITEACKVWKKLKEMGQKKGEALYNEYCK